MNHKELIEAAIDVRNRAYAPYSNFRVGAAVQTLDGEWYLGCNVENGSYGLSICAERNAICQAISAGHQQFSTLVVAAVPLVAPCGACRQFIYEFGEEIEVICVHAERPDEFRQNRASEWLPDAFRLD